MRSSSAERAPLDADVLVVGAGAAGAAAFLEVEAAGLTAIGVDALPAFGGTAATSGGGCCVAGTDLQRSRGIDDSPDAALEDLLAHGGGEADEAWARFYFEHAAADVYDWLVSQGVRFVDVHGQEGSRFDRWHQPDGNGRGLMGALWSAIEGRGSADRWRLATRVDDLLVEDGRVVGARTTDAEGSAREVRARAVVMATGGFAGSRDAIVAYADPFPDGERFLVGGGVGATGDGHRILEGHGADLTHLGNLCSYAFATPDFRDPTGLRGLVVRGLGGAIWVNRSGRRFHDESRTGPASGTPALLAQDPPTCWAILDEAIVPALRVADAAFRGHTDSAADRIAELVRTSPWIHEADDPASLARASGIDPDALDRTIRDWNALVASGAERDSATGRSLVGLRPLAGRLVAIQFFPLVRKNLGGVRTDLRGRVLDGAGRTIPGLYAAGELTGFGGGHLNGRHALEGMMIGGSLFSGRVAGAWAAHEAGGPTPARFEAAPSTAAAG